MSELLQIRRNGLHRTRTVGTLRFRFRRCVFRPDKPEYPRRKLTHTAAVLQFLQPALHHYAISRLNSPLRDEIIQRISFVLAG
ncbi:hypothetical protein D3C75_977470 [compost metagenome]